MRTILIILLSIIQIPCILEGWLSYVLNYLIKMLARIIFLLAIVSFIWWPLDMFCGICWASCEYIKLKLQDVDIDFSRALALYMQHYPQL